MAERAWDWEDVLRALGAAFDRDSLTQLFLTEFKDELLVQAVMGGQPYQQRLGIVEIDHLLHAARRQRRPASAALAPAPTTTMKAHGHAIQARRYETVLREVGRWVARKQLTGLVVLELQEGIVVRGFLEKPSVRNEKKVTVADQWVFDNATLDSMAALAPQLRGRATEKRG